MRGGEHRSSGGARIQRYTSSRRIRCNRLPSPFVCQAVRISGGPSLRFCEGLITTRNQLTGLAFVGLMTLLLPRAIHGQQTQPAPAKSEELTKKLSNPISDLVSVPFQFNWEQGVGPDEQTRFVLNVQPVMPFTLNQDWNLIARAITPLFSQSPLFEGGSATFGVSDILTSFFFSPSKGAITWGVGPVISLPSTTEPTLGTEEWSAGPTAIALRQRGPWTYGVLWNQIWSFRGQNIEKRSMTIVEGNVGYQIADSFDFLAGVRGVSNASSLAVDAGTLADADGGFVDPIVGARFRRYLSTNSGSTFAGTSAGSGPALTSAGF